MLSELAETTKAELVSKGYIVEVRESQCFHDQWYAKIHNDRLRMWQTYWGESMESAFWECYDRLLRKILLDL